MKKRRILFGKNRAFTIIEMLIVVALIAAAAGILKMALSGRETAAKATACKATQSELLSCKQMWAHDNNKLGTDPSPTMATLLAGGANGSYFTGAVEPTCPCGGTYTLGATVNDPVTCNYSGH